MVADINNIEADGDGLWLSNNVGSNSCYSRSVVRGNLLHIYGDTSTSSLYWDSGAQIQLRISLQ